MISNEKWSEILTGDIIAVLEYYNIEVPEKAQGIVYGDIKKIILEIIEAVQGE